MKHVRSYRPLQNRTTGKWTVVNECDEYEAGEFDTKEQADQWIDQQRILQQGIDG